MSQVRNAAPWPQANDLEVYIGTDNVLTFVLTDADGRPVDITTDEVKFTARDWYAGTATIATKTNGVGQHLAPTNGQTQFTLTHAELTAAGSSVRPTQWLYEVRRVAASTSYETVHATGRLTVRPAVTAG
jgi:hypothetical protein